MRIFTSISASIWITARSRDSSSRRPRTGGGAPAFIDQLVERIEQTPDVRSAAVTVLVPLGGDALVASFPSGWPQRHSGDAAVDGQRRPALFRDPGHPAAAADANSRRRIAKARRRWSIVNQTFAETYFGSGNPLGQRVETGGEADAEIVGVAANSKLDTIGEAPKSVVYYPFAQRPRRLTVIARTAGDPAAMLPAVRRAMTELDSAAGVSVGTLKDAASMELSMRRVGTQFVGAIGIVGLLLTGIGLYGVVSYLVGFEERRTGHSHRARRDPWPLTSRSARPHSPPGRRRNCARRSAAILIALALKTFLAGLSPLDPIAFAAAAAVMVLVAFAASYLPARRVARVDPLQALRE